MCRRDLHLAKATRSATCRLISLPARYWGLTTRARTHLVRGHARLARGEVSPHELQHRFGYVLA